MMMNTNTSSEFLNLANELADTARPIAMHYFKEGVSSTQKSDNSPVTVADQEIETKLRDMIMERFPDHGILGEEYDSINLDAKYVWVLDPIDGTHCFSVGFLIFGTMIALLEDGKPILGVIDAPAMDDRWIGIKGQPSTLNGQPIKTKACANLDQAWITSSSPFMFEEGAQRESYNKLQHSSSQRPVFSGNCVAYGLIASGKLDIVCEADLGVYDFMAVIPIIEGAGGVVTDWQGDTLTMESEGVVLASGDPKLHQEAIKVLTGQK